MPIFRWVRPEYIGSPSSELLQKNKIWLPIFESGLSFHTEMSTCLLACDREVMIMYSVMVLDDIHSRLFLALQLSMQIRDCVA